MAEKFRIRWEQGQILQDGRALRRRRYAQDIVILLAQAQALADPDFGPDRERFHPHLQGLAGDGIIGRAEFDADGPARAEDEGTAHAEQCCQFGKAAGGIFGLAVGDFILHFFCK